MSKQPENENLFGDDAPPDFSKHIFSMGAVCQLLQKLPADVEAIAKAAGVEPFLWIDAVCYYKACDVQTMGEFITKFRTAAASN